MRHQQSGAGRGDLALPHPWVTSGTVVQLGPSLCLNKPWALGMGTQHVVGQRSMGLKSRGGCDQGL